MPGRHVRGLWALAALLLPAAAQQGTTELRGRVIDAQGAVLQAWR